MKDEWIEDPLGGYEENAVTEGLLFSDLVISPPGFALSILSRKAHFGIRVKILKSSDLQVI
jgi:hypothetical protein